jgi:hypothetical protein
MINIGAKQWVIRTVVADNTFKPWVEPILAPGSCNCILPVRGKPLPCATGGSIFSSCRRSVMSYRPLFIFKFHKRWLDGSTNTTGCGDKQEHTCWQEGESFRESAVGYRCCYYAKQHCTRIWKYVYRCTLFRSSNPPPKYPSQYCDLQFSLPWILRPV